MIFSSVLIERMENTFIEKSQSQWLSRANLVASQIREGNYLKDDSNYTYFKSLIVGISKEKDLDSRIIVVDKKGY